MTLAEAAGYGNTEVYFLTHLLQLQPPFKWRYRTWAEVLAP